MTSASEISQGVKLNIRNLGLQLMRGIQRTKGQGTVE